MRLRREEVVRMAAKKLGARAIVLGGGFAGKLAARVLSDHFDSVVVLERDAGPEPDGYRKGVPQARFVHTLLRGGLQRIEALFPGFENELYARGSVRCRPARDMVFFDSLGLWNQDDVGPEQPLQTRPLLEGALEDRVTALPNVQLRRGVVVHELIAEGDRVIGVATRDAAGTSRRELADLIVDATGRSAHSPEWLRRIGFPEPPETRVEVDINYAGCLARPKRTPAFLGAMVAEPPPDGRYGSLINMQENGLIIACIGSRGQGTPLADDYPSMLSQLERLPHPAAFEMARDCEPVSKFARFGFAASVHRHYERLERVPEGFLCIGDAICSFNPVWGQGISVSAMEADVLGRMLIERAGDGSLTGLPSAFYAESARIIATPWSLSVGPDLAYTSTRAERAPDSKAGRGFMRALGQLAKRDPEVRELVSQVFHMTKPREALATPEMLAKLAPLMANPGA